MFILPTKTRQLDNKRDKGAARLDQIRARKKESALVLVYASLLRTMLANHLVYIDLRDRPPPAHRSMAWLWHWH